MFAKDFPRRPMRSLIVVERDLLWQPALALERPPEKRFGGCNIPLGAEQKIHRLSLLVDSTVKICPLAFDLHIGFVDSPGCADPAGETVPPLFELRNIARYPAHDRSVTQGNSALGHHFHKISKAELEPQIPAHAEDNDLPVELTALEKIIHAQHPSSLPQKVSSRGICPAFAVCTRAAGRLLPIHPPMFINRSDMQITLGWRSGCSRSEHGPFARWDDESSG